MAHRKHSPKLAPSTQLMYFYEQKENFKLEKLDIAISIFAHIFQGNKIPQKQKEKDNLLLKAYKEFFNDPQWFLDYPNSEVSRHLLKIFLHDNTKKLITSLAKRLSQTTDPCKMLLQFKAIDSLLESVKIEGNGPQVEENYQFFKNTPSYQKLQRIDKQESINEKINEDKLYYTNTTQTFFNKDQKNLKRYETAEQINKSDCKATQEVRFKNEPSLKNYLTFLGTSLAIISIPIVGIIIPIVGIIVGIIVLAYAAYKIAQEKKLPSIKDETRFSP